MNPLRRSLLAAGAIALLGAWSLARAQDALPVVTVYKSPSCGCCGGWVTHMRAGGFRVETRDLDDVTPIKRKHGITERLSSCHTAIVGDYAVEGHVPAADIKRLLRERPQAKGLAVPGMPVGSPGMEQGRPQPYATLAFYEGGRTQIFERH